MKRNIAYIMLLALMLPVMARAEQPANYSHVSPYAARPASCPEIKQYTPDEEVRGECRGGDWWDVTYRLWHLWLNDYFITHMCYRPSCYYEEIAYIDQNFPIQPLTENANSVINIIDNITLARLSNSKAKVTGQQGSSVDAPLLPGQISAPSKVQEGLSFTPMASGPVATGTGGVHIQPNPARYLSPILPNSVNGANPYGRMTPYTTSDMGNIEAGGGTSAIQGLLWSWRMVSNAWVGKWSGTTSDYGLTTPAELPKKTNLKNIILISDGADTDGPANPATNSPASIGSTVSVPGGTVTYVGSNRGVPNEMGQQLSVDASQLGGETCDAHVPVEAITDKDYQTLCDGLYQQGIRVHVIYFGYSAPPNGDARLGYCANRTRGLIFNNETNLVSAFNQIFASIAAQNVRLVVK